LLELFAEFNDRRRLCMRIPLMVITTALVLVSVIYNKDASASLTSSFRTSVPAAHAAHDSVELAMSAPRFSSAYTSLTNCGSGVTKREEREAEKRGQDIPSRCRGLDGYVIDISYSACASNISAQKGRTRIPLAMQTVGWKQKTVEWRLANGKPFAVIMRVYEYGGDDLCATNGKTIGESLVVKGLKGYEHIDEEVKVKSTPNPNVKARELADKGYR
jgi:hypothetical protein